MADLPNNQAPGTARTLYAYTKHGYAHSAKDKKSWQTRQIIKLPVQGFSNGRVAAFNNAPGLHRNRHRGKRPAIK